MSDGCIFMILFSYLSIIAGGITTRNPASTIRSGLKLSTFASSAALNSSREGKSLGDTTAFGIPAFSALSSENTL